ncbi:MAG: transposase [Candidatus Izemoplasmatales bacterium]|nr:transposase [Candidatus Izemoplasmatales bacterium]
MKERKTQKHKKFSIEEKNQIVVLYLDKHMRMIDIVRLYEIPHESMLKRWVNQFREFGTCVDRRGKGPLREGVKRGRPKKHMIPLEEMSKKDLIEKVRMYEDIKKSLACLMNQPRSKNIK